MKTTRSEELKERARTVQSRLDKNETAEDTVLIRELLEQYEHETGEWLLF